MMMSDEMKCRFWRMVHMVVVLLIALTVVALISHGALGSQLNPDVLQYVVYSTPTPEWTPEWWIYLPIVMEPEMPPPATSTPTSTPIVPTSTPIVATPTPVPSTPLPTPTPVPGQVRAFPGAEGFGAESVGGRGGRVIEVTNLSNSGSGSLRECIEASGPRICVFRTGGTIELQSSLQITNPYITIAGQTAPGEGITLRNDPSNRASSIIVRTHDVILRYIRVRPGPSRKPSSNVDAMTIIGGAHNVIVDHCSFSWATDEVINTWYNPHDVTVQWSIISEGLHCSTHSQGCHSCGALFGSAGAHSISFHHNISAHAGERLPYIKSTGIFDAVNNVSYNGRYAMMHANGENGGLEVNFVGNFIKYGPDSYRLSPPSIKSKGGARVYVQGNIGPDRTSSSEPEENIISGGIIVLSRFPAPPVTIFACNSATDCQARDQVLAGAGATIGLDSQGNSYWRRDAIDERVVNDVKNGTGNIIDDPSDVGGWLNLDEGTPYADSDHDGMADDWENLHGFDPNNSSDGPQDTDGDGYTNVEEYLNGTNPNN